ncbi:hypothetical protein [Candidatus Leptofilum sp.]|uniref:hypothetical protein n=1 Tax=Candidatus Leptofilum sp. TaxID=3241576 RepID=UPI003B5B82F5
MNQFSVKIIHINNLAEQSVAIIKLNRAIQADTFEAIIAAAHSLFAEGHTQMIVDLANMPRLNLTALFTLYSIAEIVSNRQPASPEDGWKALHEMADRPDAAMVANLKLCAPQPKVERALQQAGVTERLGIFTSLPQALEAFGKTAVSKPQPLPLPARRPIWQMAVTWGSPLYTFDLW